MRDEALKLVLGKIKSARDCHFAAIDTLLFEAEEILEQALAAPVQDALHKMAEESKTIGLRLDDWDKINCVNHDCDKCKAVQEPEVDLRTRWPMSGWKENQPTPPAAQRQRVVFPTMLRKMWSGGEVQAWLDENVNKENT